MAIFLQSLSWTLIYSLGQGFVLFAGLWLVLRLMPSLSANVKYHLALSTLAVMLACFIGTLWQQYLQIVAQSSTGVMQNAIVFSEPLTYYGIKTNSLTPAATLAPFDITLHWLSTLYVLGLAIMVGKLLLAIPSVYSLKNSGQLCGYTKANDILSTLKMRLGISVPIRLMESARAQVPMVIGFLKPIILLPLATMGQLSPEQLQTILLHELAHIKRQDYLINIIQTFAETVLFFNPFAWMVSAITRQEREHCCDDLVLDHTSEPLIYATALASITTGQANRFTVAATGNTHLLLNRIKRIMEMKKNPLSNSRAAAAVLLIVTITCSVAWLTPVFAAPKKDKQASKTNAKADPSDLKTKQLQPAPSIEYLVVQRMAEDHVISEVQGFKLEKKDGKLFVDDKALPDDVAAKYLPLITQPTLRVEVFPFMERLKMHPDAGFFQLLTPVSSSSGCVDYSQKKKDGC